MILKLITTAVLATAVAATVAAPASAGVNGRQANQQGRIYAGVANGSLTPGEFLRLERQQASIHRHEMFLRTIHGGRLTAFDRFVLNQRLNRASNNIWNKKH